MVPRHLSLRVRILIIPALAALGLLAFAVASVMSLSQSLMDTRRVQISSVVENALGIAQAFHARAAKGEMTEAEAKTQALAAIGMMRFDGDNYLWINDLDGILLMHPFRPKEVGNSMMGLKDPAGTMIYQEFVAAAKRGGGPVNYVGRRPGGASHDSPKLAQIGLFAPWGWGVGTGVYIDDVHAAIRVAIIKVAVIALIILAVVAAVSVWIGMDVGGRVRSLAQTMRRLAQGDLNVQVAPSTHGDEIGEMAEAVAVFRENAVEKHRLQQANDSEQEMRDRRQAAVERLTQDFNQGVQGVLQSVGASALQLRGAAQALTEVANGTSDQASAVATAAHRASTNVETVAAAAGEMAASQSEITQQVSRSSDVARQAAHEAEEIDTTVQGLVQATDKIGAIVGMINAIAAQTNLLALNATIEAARAGDAGKGFAVVANEVKMLANQTAKATEEISSQIVAVQGVTNQTVHAIRGMAKTIAEIDRTAAAIAEAVTRQTEASEEIARNVQEASDGTREVTSHITRVSDGAGTTGQSAAQLLETAHLLTQQADELTSDVRDFLTAIRETGDRRQFDRQSLEVDGTIQWSDGRQQTVRTCDISAGGVCLNCVLDAPVGTSFTLYISQLGKVRTRLVSAEDSHTHLQFALDENSRQRVSAYMDRIAHPVQDQAQAA